MNEMHEEIVERQADIVGMLLHHIHGPVIGDQYVRGVLPAPPPVAAIRVVTGSDDAYASDQLVAYEFALPEDTAPSIARRVVGSLRTLLTGTHIYPSDRISKVMGMTVVHVDTDGVDVAEPTPNDKALSFLRPLVHPYAEEEEEQDPRLVGFLLRGEDKLRLYFSTEGSSEIVASDVCISGATTALLTALPSLLDEEVRTTVDETDPHCTRVVDLTDW